MSDRLLHEKLREWASNRPFRFNEAWEEFEVAGNDNMLAAFADEIERQYVPVPRFTDGTRVEMGCKVEGGTVEGWCVWDDGSFDLYNDEGDTIHEGKPGDFAKPPETDSLEKLRDYVEECRQQECGSAHDAYREIADRLTALMERGER